ncbi:DUF6356 family protein [Sphingomonas sp. H39-1-10]|uniref:DUF6356 family protein n=1 Tax=Sphingomonas pollutisoli TaxID=3030829 RepID=UPI0023B887C0|nr:DUF6356 family protein [Sphingomonas pollutisoli]MDF0488159.1 DUF6356 family protein [Sphingomonas pollutisoli]
MFRRLFLDHPASVGESYGEHFGVASRFGVTMIAAGVAALIHGILPFAFKTTGSRAIIRLHRQIAEKRAATAAATEQVKTVEYVI